MRRTIQWFLIFTVILGLSASAALAQDGETEEDTDILVEITGEVEMLSDDEIVVGGVTVAPAGAFNPSSLELGDEVVITGYLLDDNTIQAVTLDMADEDVDDEDVDDEDEDEDEDSESCVGADPHPVAMSISEEFGVSYDTVIGWHCEGEGFGNIIRALELVEEYGGSVEGLLERAKGEGWGSIRREFGDLGPDADRVIGKDRAPGQQDKDDKTPPGQQDKGDKTPPGQQDKGDKTPPGQQDKDDKGNPGGQGGGKGKK